METLNTKMRIQDEVLKLMLKKDISCIRVKELTESLQISRGTFYLHYDSAYAVLQQIEEDCLHELHEAFSNNSKYSFSDIYFHYPNLALLQSINFLRKNKSKYESLLGKHGDPMFQIGCNRFANQFIIERAIKEKYIIIDSTLKTMIYNYMIAGYNSIMSYLLAEDTQENDEELSILIYRMLFGPFRSIFPQ